MNISDIKIRKLMNDGRLRAVVSITLDDEIAIHDIKVVQGPERLFRSTQGSTWNSIFWTPTTMRLTARKSLFQPSMSNNREACLQRKNNSGGVKAASKFTRIQG